MKKQIECETCNWRSSEIGYFSACPAHQDKYITKQKIKPKVKYKIITKKKLWKIPDNF